MVLSWRRELPPYCRMYDIIPVSRPWNREWQAENLSRIWKHYHVPSLMRNRYWSPDEEYVRTLVTANNLCSTCTMSSEYDSPSGHSPLCLSHVHIPTCRRRSFRQNRTISFQAWTTSPLPCGRRPTSSMASSSNNERIFQGSGQQQVQLVYLVGILSQSGMGMYRKRKNDWPVLVLPFCRKVIGREWDSLREDKFCTSSWYLFLLNNSHGVLIVSFLVHCPQKKAMVWCIHACILMATTACFILHRDRWGWPLRPNVVYNHMRHSYVWSRWLTFSPLFH